MWVYETVASAVATMSTVEMIACALIVCPGFALPFALFFSRWRD